MTEEIDDPRAQAYDETIKALEKKDLRSLAEFVMPSVKEADKVAPEDVRQAMSDFREADMMAKVVVGTESYLEPFPKKSKTSSTARMQIH